MFNDKQLKILNFKKIIISTIKDAYKYDINFYNDEFGILAPELLTQMIEHIKEFKFKE